jgi:hypothetical protein
MRCALDPLFLACETPQNPSAKAPAEQIEQLIANHPPEGDGDNHQPELQ